MIWSPDQVETLKRLHGTMPLSEIQVVLGVSKGSLRGKITTLGIGKKARLSEAYWDALRAAYASAENGGFLDANGLAARWNVDPKNICRDARKIGLKPDPKRLRKADPAWKRPKVYMTSAERSAIRKKWLQDNEHPRGMLGKRHTAETRQRASETGKARWASMSESERADFTMASLKAKVAKYGTMAPPTRRGSWKAGWREIGTCRKYYRSRWEANYARYLQWLVNRGDILDWKHEPETFWFEAIKRGTRSYLPDFRVWEVDGTSKLHEVKGWMDSRSKTTLKRMAKYHPAETIVLIEAKQYHEIERKLGSLIEGWE